MMTAVEGNWRDDGLNGVGLSDGTVDRGNAGAREGNSNYG